MSEADHETVSFAAFLEYRARRMRAPVADATPRLPDVTTRPPDPPEPARHALAREMRT